MMITFNTVEDYIEVIAGSRDPLTNKLTHSWLTEPIISLARYDVNVITSMSEQIAQSVGFTEKQADLATKIVLKYARQLAIKNIDVSPVNAPVFRLPIRSMDYSRTVELVDDFLQLRFPFDSKLIEQVKAFAKMSQGVCMWDVSKKVWKSALTEFNLNWIYNFAKLNNFQISIDVQKLYDKLIEVETQPYQIELAIEDDKFVINNAPTSLLDYVAEHVGSLEFDNFYKLVDFSSVIGYSVNPAILDAIVADRGVKFLSFISSRELKINPAQTDSVDSDLESLVKYANATNRFPIVVYEPDLGDKLFSKISKYYDKSEVVTVGTTIKNLPDISKYKVVHIAKPIRSVKIPLLVSGAGMMFGGDKQLMQQNTEKVLYVAADVYTAANKNKKVSNLSG